MRYRVTFYRLEADTVEAAVTEHEVGSGMLAAYVAAPKVTLAAIRLAKPSHRIDGFRVIDETGQVVANHVEGGGV